MYLYIYVQAEDAGDSEVQLMLSGLGMRASLDARFFPMLMYEKVAGDGEDLGETNS